MKVVFVIIDALPNRLVSEELTPNLWLLAMEGDGIPGAVELSYLQPLTLITPLLLPADFQTPMEFS